MWIVTQDRKSIIYTYKVHAEGNMLLAYNDSEYCIIGEFDNEDQVKEEVKKITHNLMKGIRVYEVNQVD